MGFYDLFHVAVLPQFVPVSQFNVSKSGLIIILQGGIIEITVFEKIVIRRAASPVAVTKKNIFRILIQREPFGSLKCFVQTKGISHVILLLQNSFRNANGR